MKITALLFSILSFSLIANAAPFPRALPSSNIEPELGVYTHEKAGFKIAAQNTGWILDLAPRDAQGMEALFHAPAASGSGLLTIRIDNDLGAPSFEAYMEKWNQEYPRYGFDVLGTRSFELNGQTGHVVDLVNRERNRQMRQVIYNKGNMAVVLSCRDEVADFEDTLKNCNSIMKSFTWLEPQAEQQGEKATTAN